MPKKDAQKIQAATTPEGREAHLESLAMDLAEKQLMAGTASAQVITHYLKLGSSKEKLEKEMLEKQLKLTEAKTEALQSAKKLESLYGDAIKAMRKYSGAEDVEDEDI